MRLSFKVFVPHNIEVFLVFLTLINCISGRRFESYLPGYYDMQDGYNRIQTALRKLDHAPQWVPNWPDPSVKMGQVSAVALDNKGQLLVFHRASHTWDASTFSNNDVYQGIGEAPIPHPTILVFNETGSLVDMWGQNLFHMPHGITVDHAGNVWVTDVALHQVFKFTPENRHTPAMVLGEKFVPRDDEEHFCKPSAVAVMRSGEFFVADGYCNTRIVKYDAAGRKLLQWGRRTAGSPFSFNVPHALTLAEDRGLVCTADREHGRVACFRADNGTFVSSYSNWLIGGRLFSVAYSPVKGGRLYIVNGPGSDVPVRGYVVDFASGRLAGTFAPPDDFRNPHDVVTAPDGRTVYVAELNPYMVHKFTDSTLEDATTRTVQMAPASALAPAKPTATVEWASSPPPAAPPGSGGGSGVWRGAAGGAGGALAAAAAAAAGLALYRARNKGRKSATRRRWEYGASEFKLRRLLSRRRFTRVRSDDSEDEPAPMLPAQPPATA